MSLDATRWAWQQQDIRPLHKLILLSLADRAGSEDEIWPSYSQIAADTGANRKTICAAIKAFKDAGILVDTGKRKGKTGQVQVLRLVGVVYRHNEQSQKRNDSKNGTVPFFPSNSTENGIVNSTENGTRNLPLNLPGTVKKVSCGKKSEITLKQFLESCKASGEQTIPKNDPVFEYAETVGLDHAMIEVCWQEFKAAFLQDDSKRQKDWRAHFRNAVRRNWYKLWYLKEGHAAQWTSVGEQARRAAA